MEDPYLQRCCHSTTFHPLLIHVSERDARQQSPSNCEHSERLQRSLTVHTTRLEVSESMYHRSGVHPQVEHTRGVPSALRGAAQPRKGVIQGEAYAVGVTVLRVTLSPIGTGFFVYLYL